MKTKTTILFLALVTPVTMALAAEELTTVPEDQGAAVTDNLPHKGPPAQAYADCRNRKAGETVSHLTREGSVTAICVESPDGLVARPQGREGREQEKGASASRYSLAQSISDRAQLSTLAFDGVAYLTGDFAADTFLPPGKVSDYFGFQYMRDIDAQGMGHNTAFLTRIAFNMLAILTPEQQESLLALAQRQEAEIRQFALLRFPLLKAFRMNLEGDLPTGTHALSLSAVRHYSAELYALDGKLAYERAQVMARLFRAFTPEQKAALRQLKFGDSASWPDMPEPMARRGIPHVIHVAIMTYASEMFSWVSGSIEADTYFCPERHGMYFGGFGMKTAPAMHQPNYAISTSLTGETGEAFLNLLTASQRTLLQGVMEQQRPLLEEIVRIRHDMAAELRRFLAGELSDESRIEQLSRRYGELDGELSFYYATAFAQIAQSLSQEQHEALVALRNRQPSGPKGPFLYSEPISMPSIEQVESFFQ